MDSIIIKNNIITIYMSLDLIAVTPNLSLEIKANEIKAKIIKRLDELKLTDQKYKLSQDILLLVANLIEHLVKDKKINKKQLLLDIFQQVYNIQANDRSQLEMQLEFLHSNKAIKKLSKFYLFACGAFEYLFKKKEKKG
jgi:hypothetical protein